MRFDRGTIWRVWLPLVVGAAALGIVFERGEGPRGPARVAGLALAMLGLAGIMLARYTLGTSFSIVPRARALVTSGIYSRIRNPIYVSGAVALGGVALMLWKLSFAILVAAMVPIQVLRARREAKVLEGAFGEEYREYRRKTWF